MTGAERFGALLSGQPPDRVPIICLLPEHGATEMGISPKEYYSDGDLVAQGQLRLRDKYGYDTLYGTFYVALEAELLGCKRLIYSENGPPNVGHLVLRAPGDLKRLPPPEEIESHPRFQAVAKCLASLKKASAGRWPVVAAISGVFSLPALLMGIEHWIEMLVTGEPHSRHALLEFCSRFCACHAAALRSAGADLIAYAEPVASATFLTQQKFRELALPWLAKTLAAIGPHGLVYFNGGGRINPMLRDVHAATGIGAYYLNPFDDIAEARNILGPQAIIVGAINDIRLLDWTPAEVESEVARIIYAGKAKGGFAFGTLLVPMKVPDSNLRALVNAAIRHGGYPAFIQ